MFDFIKLLWEKFVLLFCEDEQEVELGISDDDDEPEEFDDLGMTEFWWE